MSDQYKYVLTEADMPKAWYNINPDMPVDLATIMAAETIAALFMLAASSLFYPREVAQGISDVLGSLLR